MARSYDFSQLHVGMELKSFAELCRIVGGDPKAKGNSRASMIKEFEVHRLGKGTTGQQRDRHHRNI